MEAVAIFAGLSEAEAMRYAMRRLVESWIRAEREYHGNSLAAAIRRLNETRGFTVTHSRVSEWRRGVYTPSQVIISAMLYRTLPWALGEAGIAAGEAQMDQLRCLLWRAIEKKGQRRFDLL